MGRGLEAMGDVRNAPRGAGEFTALPVAHHINETVALLKEHFNDGVEGYSVKKISAYLGYRVISYSLISTLANLISTLLCGLLTLFTYPFSSGNPGSVHNWCRGHLKASVSCLAGNIVDDLLFDVKFILVRAGLRDHQ